MAAWHTNSGGKGEHHGSTICRWYHYVFNLRHLEGLEVRLRRCLSNYSLISGLKINLSMNCLYGVGMDEEFVHAIVLSMGCRIRLLLMRYLGLQLEGDFRIFRAGTRCWMWLGLDWYIDNLDSFRLEVAAFLFERFCSIFSFIICWFVFIWRVWNVSCLSCLVVSCRVAVWIRINCVWLIGRQSYLWSFKGALRLWTWRIWAPFWRINRFTNMLISKRPYRERWYVRTVRVISIIFASFREQWE